MAAFRIFNSRTRRKDPFTAKGGRVGIYVCGITPYGVTHLGHAFTYTHFDVLGRWLRHLGYRTTYTQNLTDIDDDMLKRAREERRDWRTLGHVNADLFLADQYWLGNLQPDIYPSASDHIPDIIALTKMLLRRGAAYEKNGSVYFRVASYPRYGEISGLPKKKMLPIANERGNRPDDPNKKDPLDFVLWQARQKGEPAWDAPFGKGRPGWHVECSAMAMKYLGNTIDIHGGGGDLIFPHHESEEAQSRAATGKPLARWWMHTGMLRYKGKKMSKSLGNLVLISDLKKKFSANAVRIYLLSRHYRSSFGYGERDMIRAAQTDLLFRRVWRLQSGQGASLPAAAHKHAFYRAMHDDMDTPKAVAALEHLAQNAAHEGHKKNIAGAKAFLTTACNILGIRLFFRSPFL